MNKQISTAAALLLCAHIAMCEQESPNIKPELTEYTRTGLINASNVAISSTLYKSINTQPDTKIQDDIDAIATTFTKFGLDWKPFAATAVSLLGALGCSYYGAYKKEYAKGAVSGIISVLGLWCTDKYLSHNHAQSNGQKIVYRITDCAILLIKKENGKLLARAHTNLLSNSSMRELNKSQEELARLAQEIIANHDEKIKDKDLYASDLFAKLVDNFKAGF